MCECVYVLLFTHVQTRIVIYNTLCTVYVRPNPQTMFNIVQYSVIMSRGRAQMQDHELPEVREFTYLGSMLQTDGGVEAETS